MCSIKATQHGYCMGASLQWISKSLECNIYIPIFGSIFTHTHTPIHFRFLCTQSALAYDISNCIRWRYVACCFLLCELDPNDLPDG